MTLFAGIPVSDYPRAREWYERLFGRPPDLVPNDSEAAWLVSEAGWIYVLSDAGRAGNAVVTLIVDDLDARLAGISARGIDCGDIETIPDIARKSEVLDPDGNKIAFGQVAQSQRK